LPYGFFLGDEWLVYSFQVWKEPFEEEINWLVERNHHHPPPYHHHHHQKQQDKWIRESLL
jgi:hypothetical protein